MSSMPLRLWLSDCIFGSGLLPGGTIAVLMDRSIDHIPIERVRESQPRHEAEFDPAWPGHRKYDEIPRANTGRLADLLRQGKLATRKHLAERHLEVLYHRSILCHTDVDMYRQGVCWIAEVCRVTGGGCSSRPSLRAAGFRRRSARAVTTERATRCDCRWKRQHLRRRLRRLCYCGRMLRRRLQILLDEERYRRVARESASTTWRSSSLPLRCMAQASRSNVSKAERVTAARRTD